MTWKGLRPVVELVEKTCKKGVRLAKKALQQYEERLKRDESLPKYRVRIQPQTN